MPQAGVGSQQQGVASTKLPPHRGQWGTQALRTLSRGYDFEGSLG